MYRSSIRLRPGRRATLLLGVVLLLLVAACSDADMGAGDTADEQDAMDDVDVAQERDDADSDDAAAGPEADAAPQGDDEGFSTALARSDEGEADESASNDNEHDDAPTGEYIIREGTMTVDVPEGGYQQAYQRLAQRARDLGGTVVSSHSETTDDGATKGTVTVRVPVDRYDDLLESTGDLGDVRTQNITSEDVSAEYVDLESRLRHERAQEEFYVGLLDQAEGVSDAIEVQHNLEQVQERIEQLQGRLNMLQSRTSYSTLTVDLVEPKTAQLLASDDSEPGIAAYFEQARRGFVAVLGWGIVAAGSLAPIILPILIAGMAWRLFRNKPKTPQPTPEASGSPTA